MLVLASCSPTDPQSDAPPDFSACDPASVVALDTIATRLPHDAFAMIRPVEWGDSLAALDHGIVVDDGGRLHCFWTRGHNWIEGEGTDFGHASSEDLVDWDIHPPIRPFSSFAPTDRVWAPQIVRESGRWWMYFTGVELRGRPALNVQRVFVASSSDLFEWSMAEPVLEPRDDRIAWGGRSDWAGDARDPMVYRYGSHLEMLLTVRLVSGEQSLARARRVDGAWQVIDVLESIRGAVLESPFVYAHAGQLYLFVNNWLDGGEAAWTASGMDGPWTRVSTEIPGFALELLELGGGHLLASRVWGSSVLLSRFFMPEFSATNMVFPACYTGSEPLLRSGDNLVRIRDPSK